MHDRAIELNQNLVVAFTVATLLLEELVYDFWGGGGRHQHGRRLLADDSKF